MSLSRECISLVLALSATLTIGCGGRNGDEAAAPPHMASTGDLATQAATLQPATPDTPARGTTHGLPFELKSADMQNNILTLHGDEGRTFFVFLFLDEGESAAGNRFSYEQAEIGDPHIHMHYRSSEGIEIDTFMEDYSMELEFGQPSGGRIPGRINLKLPDQPGSFVTGSFEAELSG